MPDGALEKPNQKSLSSGPPDISITFAATELAVRHAMATVRSALRFLSLSELAIGTVEIVLAEVTNNIVEHAYQNTGKGSISLRCCAGDDMLMFEITDTGQALPDHQLPKKKTHDLSVGLDGLPEGGFGWGLIRDMTSSLAYRRVSHQNVLRFSIPTHS